MVPLVQTVMKKWFHLDLDPRSNGFCNANYNKKMAQMFVFPIPHNLQRYTAQWLVGSFLAKRRAPKLHLSKCEIRIAGQFFTPAAAKLKFIQNQIWRRGALLKRAAVQMKKYPNTNT